jgi:anti-sigma-K factor RskA
MRLHNQLRRAGDVAEPSEGGPAGGPPRLELPPASVGLSERIETIERDLTGGQTELKEAAERSERAVRLWRVAIVLLVAGLGTGGFFVSRLQRQVDAAEARVADAENRAQAAAESADRQITATREDATRQILQAQEAALKAQTISDVLAAPDLIRFNLVGGDNAALARAQVLWSRSRGLVFSGTRLPPAPPNWTYQVWLLTNDVPVSAGTFVPDASGRFTLATDTPPPTPRLVGASVTIEPAGGRERPTGFTLLARAE